MRLVPVLVIASFLPVAGAADASGSKPEYPEVPPGQTRSEKALAGGKMPYWPDRSDQAQPLVATFLGGMGHEWLCAGGFQPNGTIVLAGNVNGGEFGFGIKESILGSDAARPEPAVYKTTQSKNGPIVEKPTWVRPDTTGFLIFTTSDLKTITKVVRLPWTSAAITTMVVANDGTIYVAGKPGPGIAALGGRQQALAIPDDATRKDSHVEAAFLAKITKDGTKVEWLLTAAGKTDAPQVGLTAEGNITFGAQDLRVFDPAGKQLSVTVVPGGVRETTAVNPKDGSVVRGGERNTGTGREPWRCPILKVYEPDGTLRYQLYEWPSRYVVLDNSRLVSDTAVRGVSFDKDGNLLVKLWSDGGNSVAVSQPTDIRRGPPNSGLGLNAAGANATSFNYLAKIDPKDYQLIGWTMWVSKYKGKANGAGIETLSYGDDGSVLFAGDSAWGLIQTGNKLANGEPGGPYIAVTTPDMTGMRFCSSVPGIGAANIGNDRDSIGIVHGVVDGKARALFLGGATADADVYGLRTKTPTLNALQTTFGGGSSDGYVVMIDLSAGTPVVKPPAPPLVPQRLLVLNAGLPIGQKNAPPKGGESTSTTFTFSATLPRWNHADAEFRVADGSYWPNFVAGRPESGEVTWGANGAKGAYTVTLDTWAQELGKQDRRVLGQLYVSNEPPKLSVSVTAFGTPAKETGIHTDARGQSREREVDYQPLEASITLGATTVKIPFKAVIRRGAVLESTMQRMDVLAFATVKGVVLGLKGDLANKDIDIRVTTQGIDPATVPAGKQKKK